MTTESEYTALRNRIDSYENTRNQIFPNKNCFSIDDIAKIVQHAGIDREPTNEERSAVEVYEWLKNAPEKYFLYIKETEKGWIATTRMGDNLGKVSPGREYRDNFGGKRVPIRVYATNGREYYGTYFKSSGDYARVRMIKS